MLSKVTLTYVLSLSLNVLAASYPPGIGTVLSHGTADFTGNALCTATAIVGSDQVASSSVLATVQKGSDSVWELGTGIETKWFFTSVYNVTGDERTFRAVCVPVGGAIVQENGQWVIKDASTTQTLPVSTISGADGQPSPAPGLYDGMSTTVLQYFLTKTATYNPSTTMSTTSSTSSSSTSATPTAPPTSSGPPLPAIIGGAVGGVVLLAGAILAFILLRRRQAKHQKGSYRTPNVEEDLYNPVLPKVTRDGKVVDLVKADGGDGGDGSVVPLLAMKSRASGDLESGSGDLSFPTARPALHQSQSYESSISHTYVNEKMLSPESHFSHGHGYGGTMLSPTASSRGITEFESNQSLGGDLSRRSSAMLMSPSIASSSSSAAHEPTLKSQILQQTTPTQPVRYVRHSDAAAIPKMAQPAPLSQSREIPADLPPMYEPGTESSPSSSSAPPSTPGNRQETV